MIAERSTPKETSRPESPCDLRLPSRAAEVASRTGSAPLDKAEKMSNDTHELKTYDALQALAKGFAQGGANLVILLGKPGLMKTETIKRAVGNTRLLHVVGKKTAVDLYRDLFEFRNELVLLDDVDPLLDDKDGQVLIRGLTETTGTRTISWGTSRRLLDKDGNEIPKSFSTTSRVMIIANHWRKGGIFSAIESRGNKFLFKPSWKQVYQQAGTWFRDQEVLDYVHENLDGMRNPDVRLLKKAVELRNLALPGHDWQDVFRPCMSTDRSQQEVIRLLSIQGVSQEERVRQFVDGGFGHRSLFFRRLKKITASQAEPMPPRIIVPRITATSAGRKPQRARARA